MSRIEENSLKLGLFFKELEILRFTDAERAFANGSDIQEFRASEIGLEYAALNAFPRFRYGSRILEMFSAVEKAGEEVNIF